MAAVFGVPTVERLNFDDRPDKHNLGGRYPGEELMRKHGLFLFRREKYSLPYGGKRAYIERRNYYDESY